MESPKFTDHFFSTEDGPRISYRIYPATGGEETGAPILCMAGLTRNLSDFDELAPRLAMMGRQVITTSQRGRGKSDIETDPSRYNPMIYTGDMLALLDHLEIKKAIFIGTSLGGLMTMFAAFGAPERIKGAVINDIGPELDPKGIARIASYVGKTDPVTDWDQAAIRLKEINGAAFPKRDDMEFWLDLAKKTYRKTETGKLELDYDPAISAAATNVADFPDLWPFFDALKPIPTLVIRGQISDLLSTETLEKMQARNRKLKTAIVPDIGHAPFLTEEQSWPAIRDFIKQIV